ncbi:MAG: hybrid sensor histidine kinase/response regulator [Magnetococcales bacterium]|nr:hybrid sensor histidine kinase/response regulator [Magnetococcales bacterium]
MKNTGGVVLIVDDQPEQIDVIKAALEAHFVIRIATDGALALKIMQSGGVDLILLDIVMPGMNGFEVCRLLKAAPETSGTPVIFLTSKESVDIEAQGLSMGAVDFIRKPSSPEVLLARAVNTIALKRAEQALQEKNAQLKQALKVREDVDHLGRHDLKGPLTAILGVPSILLDDDNLTKTQRTLLHMMERSSYTMLEMINRSLDMIKMENGTYQFEPERFDLAEVLERVVGDLGRMASPKDIDIRILHASEPNDTPHPFFVMGEKMLCYPLFYNLFLNAIEASPKKSLVSVSLVKQDKHGVIYITNSGSVPDAIGQRFFEKYVTEGKKTGTGLGTYSARLAARTQRGEITLDTSVPEQTTLVVELPLGVS